jgi:RNA polymerase sigma-70 factor (ECF subfamily)
MVEATRPTGAPAAVAEPTEIIAKARRGDSEAWGEVYRHYAPAIFRFCRRVLPTREDAEDATMEIFLKLRDKLNQYEPDRPFSAWLYRVAANHCWDQLRRRKLRQDRETEDVDEVPLQHPDPSQLEQLITERSGTEVRQALGTLPARARMALVLRYYADMDYNEIADALGVERTFVGVVLLRARHQLRDAMRAAQQTLEPEETHERSHERS